MVGGATTNLFQFSYSQLKKRTELLWILGSLNPSNLCQTF